MQFVAGGPDIPDTLLQSHEEGRAVFFCGAGISYPAGLPGFKGLVNGIYHRVGTTRRPSEESAYSCKQYDTTLDLLERRLLGQRIKVRKTLSEVLKPNLCCQGAMDTHAALLQLGHNRKDELRLVTTNFDRIFERVAKWRTKQVIKSYEAPLLPILKNSRWNGLVYLHGLLPDKPDEEDESALNRLVLTSGDFGLAYLTERWAARFVSELFRNYVVCFVGYSIDDPILRYMMDALAADQMLGEDTPQAYALTGFGPGKEKEKAIEWKAKGVMPILYAVAEDTQDHSALSRTLKAWADTYRDGISGKEYIVVRHASLHPSDSTQQDDFVGRVLWALSDKSGLPAKRFADFNPVPKLAWLDAFSEACYEHRDLSRFGVLPNTEVDDELRFSLVHRPAPYTHAPQMTLVSGGTADSRWDNVMHHLARWLTRHLNDPKLIIWLGQSGGRLHDVLVRLIEKELDHFMRLEQEDKAAKIELEKIRANSTNAIPDPLMRKLWHLLLTGRVKSPKYKLSLFNWNNRLKREGLTTTLRLELRELLAPKVQLKQPFHWRDGDESTDALEHQKQPVDCELVLATDHVHSLFKELDKDEHWHEALPALLDDFQKLLLDALDLLRELEQAGDRRDLSYLYLPSISPHWQNKEYYDWVVLIELLRDAWQVVRKRDFKQATKIAQDWFDVPYPTFKRLALFAASHDSCIVPDQWVDWLITDDAWWLWYGGTQRETMRLLVLQGVSLSPEMRDRLEARILVGPPRAMYREDIEPKHWRLAVDRSVWLRLAKLREGSGKLGNAAEQRFDELSNKNPEWKLKDHERDEFSHWMSGTGDPDYEAYRYIDIAPRKRRELIEWLKQPDQGPFHEDTWRETCRTRFFHSCLALCDLAKGGIWPAGRWGTALYAWGEGGRVPLRSWQFTAPLVQAMPDKDFQDIAHSVSFWMKVVSKSIEPHEEVILFDLCRRLLELPEPDDKETDDFVFQAINHSVGHVTEALLNRWFKREPNDNDGLPEDISLFFTKLCDVGVHKFRHGRVLLASQLISLFRVDRNWTEKHLLPLFTWKTDAKEAKAVWEGFLWSPHLYPPLLLALKSQFIETARHYKELGEFGSQYVILLTYAALDRIDGYGLWDYRNAIASLPQEGLEKSAQTLYQALSSSGEQRENYWKNRIHPFWQDLWPKSGDLVSPGIAEFLAQLSIAARREFPTALSIVYDWLRPIEYPVYAISQLCKSELTIRFPDHALDFLDAVIDSRSGRQLWVPHGDIRKSLEEIIAADGSLAEDPRYKQLHEYCRQHDI